MNSATEAKDTTLVNTLHVGLRFFPGYEWREAILFYLNARWAGRTDQVRKPKIKFKTPFFGGPCITLALNTFDDKYTVYGESDNLPLPAYLADLSVSPMRADTEIGLISFVKNDKIKHLCIKLSADAFIMIWKGQGRSELHITARGIPRSLPEVED